MNCRFSQLRDSREEVEGLGKFPVARCILTSVLRPPLCTIGISVGVIARRHGSVLYVGLHLYYDYTSIHASFPSYPPAHRDPIGPIRKYNAKRQVCTGARGCFVLPSPPIPGARRVKQGESARERQGEAVGAPGVRKSIKPRSRGASLDERRKRWTAGTSRASAREAGPKVEAHGRAGMPDREVGFVPSFARLVDEATTNRWTRTNGRR